MIDQLEQLVRARAGDIPRRAEPLQVLRDGLVPAPIRGRHFADPPWVDGVVALGYLDAPEQGLRIPVILLGELNDLKLAQGEIGRRHSRAEELEPISQVKRVAHVHPAHEDVDRQSVRRLEVEPLVPVEMVELPVGRESRLGHRRPDRGADPWALLRSRDPPLRDSVPQRYAIATPPTIRKRRAVALCPRDQLERAGDGVGGGHLALHPLRSDAVRVDVDQAGPEDPTVASLPALTQRVLPTRIWPGDSCTWP